MKTLLIAGGDNISVLQALGDLFQVVLVQLNLKSPTIVIATSEDEILRALCRVKVDLLVLNHERVDAGRDLVRWINQGPFKMKKVLIGAPSHLATMDFRVDGIDATLTRPVNKDELKQVLRDLLSTENIA